MDNFPTSKYLAFFFSFFFSFSSKIFIICLSFCFWISVSRQWISLTFGSTCCQNCYSSRISKDGIWYIFSFLFNFIEKKNINLYLSFYSCKKGTRALEILASYYQGDIQSLLDEQKTEKGLFCCVVFCSVMLCCLVLHLVVLRCVVFVVLCSFVFCCIVLLCFVCCIVLRCFVFFL